MSDDADATPEPGREIWIEKYRPQTLDEIKGQDDIVERLQSYIDQQDLPHLLFSGRAGIGKTTAATAIAREVYGDDWRGNFLELNASDQRGIDVVRDRIKNFARSSFGGFEYRVIFLDEADSLTSDAQSALRRTMEQFSDNTDLFSPVTIRRRSSTRSSLAVLSFGFRHCPTRLSVPKSTRSPTPKESKSPRMAAKP